MSENPTRSQGAVGARLAEAADAFQERLRGGASPDVDAFAAGYPEIADELRQLLPVLGALGSLTEDDLTQPEPASPALRTLGDFAIRREIGRGGMGVVYEAEQISLARRVALKVLPFAAVMDPRQLQRFKNEAQAAAHLHHTNIVPVHSVGQERGVHYYAMQYIEGLTVGQIIKALRAREGRSGDAGPPADESSSAAMDAFTSGSSTQSPAFCRAVARLGIQAAEALDHAHQQGVIHRDIKPANLIVDAGSNVWITDFGLASFVSTETRSLTMAGDLLGTLRYMSPEQALAKRVPIDHRTDTYSLGATLYEFLTLEHAITGKGSQQILHDIAFKEPDRARSLNPAVPDDLETILMKAMAKAPAERYETAQQLADDLRRYLEHKPIEARRPTLLKRTAKWCGRHKAAVATASIVGVLALVGLATSTALVRTAYTSESRQRARAEANFDRARRAIDSMLIEVGARELADMPGASDARRRLLEKARGFYAELVEDAGAAPDEQLDAARAHTRIGDIARWLQDWQGAKDALSRAAEIADPLVEASPQDPQYALAAAEAYRSLAAVLGGTDRVAGPPEVSPSAERAFARAIALGERVVADFPGVALYEEELAHSNNDLGVFRFQVGRFADAEEPLLKAASTYEDLLRGGFSDRRYALWLVGAQQNIAIVYMATDRKDQAASIRRRLTEALTDLVQRYPGERSVRLALVRAHANTGVLFSRPTLLPVGLYSAHTSERHSFGPAFSASANTAPGTTGPLPDVAAIWSLPPLERSAASSAAARDLVRPLVTEYPELGIYQAEYSKASINLACCQLYQGDVDAALATLRDGVAVAPGYAWGHSRLAMFLSETREPRLQDVAGALRAAEEAVTLPDAEPYEWWVLALCRYRNGDIDGAYAASERASERGSTVLNCFLRAMILQRRGVDPGEERDARFWFGRGLEGIEHGRQGHPSQLWPFRLEAAELLDVEDEAPPPDLVILR